MLATYLLLLVVAFAINAVPAFMPPTWMVVSFFYLHYHLAFLPTVALGVVGSTCGRIVLALMARSWLRPYLPAKFYKNYAYLGRYLGQNRKLTVPLVLSYAFMPISSNSLFIMAGLANIDLKLLILSFIVGKICSYSFWTTATYQLAGSLGFLFKNQSVGVKTTLTTLVSIGLIVLVGKIKWEKFLKLNAKKTALKQN